jgi:hypothetical protein
MCALKSGNGKTITLEYLGQLLQGLGIISSLLLALNILSRLYYTKNSTLKIVSQAQGER